MYHIPVLIVAANDRKVKVFTDPEQKVNRYSNVQEPFVYDWWALDWHFTMTERCPENTT